MAGKNRIYYLDTFRFLAALLIFLTHYINRFSPDSFRFLPRGVTGKLGVAMLCVILGYFAYKKGMNTKKTVAECLLERYLYFVLIIIAYAIVASCVHLYVNNSSFMELVQIIIKDGFTLSREHNNMFWSLIPMLIGSGICYYAGRGRLRGIDITLILIMCYLLGEVWILNCVLGAYLVLCENNERAQQWLGKIWIQAILLVSAVWIIRGDESNWIYLMDGIACLFCVLVCMNNKYLRLYLAGSL